MKIWNLDNGVGIFNKDDLAKNIKMAYDKSKKKVISYEFPMVGSI